MCSYPAPGKALPERAPAGADWARAAFYVLLFGVYLTLNSVLNIANRWALGLSGFAFPILLTMAHAAFSFSVLGPVLSAMKVDHGATLRKSWRGIAVIGVLMGANIACNNLSLVHLPLSLNQVTRASLPVVTAAVAVMVEKKVPTREECGALVLLTLGVTVTVFEGKATGSGAGLMLCVAGVLCGAAMLSTAGRVLAEKMNVLQLTFYTAPVSCAMLFPVYLVREHAAFMSYLQTNQRGVIMIVAFSSMVALAYNVTHNFLLQRTSAVTVTVLGEVKIVGLLLLSAMLLPGESNQFTLKMTVGCVLAIAGFCLYSNAKISAQRLPTPAAVQADAAAFSQEQLLELITTEGKVAGKGAQHALRGCNQLPLLGMLQQVVVRRPAAAKAGKFGSGPTYMVADSTLKDPEAAPLLRPAAELGDDAEAGAHGGYAGLGGALTHVNGCRTPKAHELGKVWPVPDHSVLNLPAPKAGPGLVPRTYEALQLFDSAPRGLSLAQPS